MSVVDTRVGSVLAGYRIERLLGRGGMSSVYLAEHLRLHRKVALKLMAPELADDERFRERFLRESQLAASLDHPNVVPVYDADESDGVLYIAMRYVEGSDLRELLRRDSPLPPARAVAIVGHAAAGLDAAHRRGLVHRDVKPGNILIGEDDHVYVSDFGLTKQASSQSGLTATGPARRHRRLRRAGADPRTAGRRPRRRLRADLRALRGARRREAVRKGHRGGDDLGAHPGSASRALGRASRSCRRASTT